MYLFMPGEIVRHGSAVLIRITGNTTVRLLHLKHQESSIFILPGP
jgi:hypothetical protein